MNEQLLNQLKMEEGFTPYQAFAEADRCLLCYDAPCSKGCIGDTNPGTFIRKLKLRNIKGAIAIIKSNNILGGVCGALCPTSDLCVKECSATSIDRPIQIGKLQRFLVEYGWKLNFNPVLKTKSRGIKIAVVGSGPSGLTCAAELCKDGFVVDIFERKPQPGGVLRYLIPDYRLSKDFLNKELNDITSLGVNIKCNSSIESEDDLKNLFEEGYKRIYIATGTWQVESLGLGSDIEGSFNAVDFLEKCKSSEKDKMVKILKDRAVFVIGGGDTALDTARTAIKFGAREVSIIYRRSFMQMPGNEKEKIAALKSGINFLILTQPVKYLSGEGKITGIEVVRNKLGDIDSSGRPRPVPVDASNHTIDADVIVEAIGLKPDISNKELFSKLQLSEKKLIVVDDKTGGTSRENIHAGGDITRGPSLIVEAVADGKIAARAIAESMELS